MANSLVPSQQLPNSVLLHAFSFLDGPSLVRASSVCQQWYKVANDEVLWQNLVHQKIQKHAPLPADKHSWREEYKRLAYHIPSCLAQDVAGHENRIVFLTFSPSGKYLASVGEDGTCRVWNYGRTITLQYTVGPFSNPPLQTSFCEFNESETLLLIAGLNDFDFEQMFVTVFSVPDFMLQYAVKGEYTNFRGAWLNDTHFLVAKRFFTDRTHFKLEAHEVKLTSKNKKRNLKKLLKKYKNKGKGVLVTHSFPSRNDFIRVIDPRKWGDLRQYYPNLDEVEMERLGNDNSQSGGGQTKQQQYIPDIDSSERQTKQQQYKPDTDSSDRESEDEQLDGENSKSDGHQVDEDSSDEDDLSDEDELTESDIESAMREPMLYYKMVRSTWFKKNRWQQTRKHVPPMKDESSRPYPQVLRQSQGGKIVTMVRDSDCGEKFEIAFFSVKDDEEVCATPFKVLKVDAKIIGLRVSHDQRYLVYSCRNQIEDDEDDSGDDSDDVDGSDDDSDDDDDWTFQSDILTVVYDLILDQCQENVYLGGYATSTDHLSYIFPDLSQDFVATGDEVTECHLWDRHYGVKLEANILHRNCAQQSSGLNAVAFHPYDQETLVTAGDDRLLKVWRSKNRQAQIARGEYLGETLGLGVMDDFGRDLAEGDERTCGRISPTFNLLFDVKKKSSKK
eukprot:XP_011425571.2 PREDICTED: uncharacterized protein LOC105327008 [Crassostrea gigas]